ncbi:MAG: hypothetical protein WC546_03515 [Candidatus Omnitrophota bacterium]
MNKEIKIQIRFVFFCLICFLVFAAGALAQEQEEVVLSTFYPSPLGIYDSITLYPVTDIVASAECTEKGALIYNNNDSHIYVCSPSLTTPSVDEWQTLGGSLWTLLNRQFYPNDASWRVGIGTLTPENKLDISGEKILIKNTANARMHIKAGGSGNASLELKQGDSNWAIVVLSSQNKLRINSGSNTLLSLNTLGTLGINTDTPSLLYKLDVNGKLRAKNIGAYRYEISCATDTCEASFVFPSGQGFSQTPVIVCSAGPSTMHTPSAAGSASCGVKNESSTGFTAVLSTHSTTTPIGGWVIINVLAVEPAN